MTAAAEVVAARPGSRDGVMLDRRLADWLCRMPFLRGFARREAARLFDIVAGFP